MGSEMCIRDRDLPLRDSKVSENICPLTSTKVSPKGGARSIPRVRVWRFLGFEKKIRALRKLRIKESALICDMTLQRGPRQKIFCGPVGHPVL